MAAKQIQKTIWTLVILLLGVNAISYIGRNSVAGIAFVNNSLVAALMELTQLISIGLILLIILLIPVYLSKSSDEKKTKI